VWGTRQNLKVAVVEVQHHLLLEIEREEVEHSLHVLLLVVGVVRELHPREDLALQEREKHAFNDND